MSILRIAKSELRKQRERIRRSEDQGAEYQSNRITGDLRFSRYRVLWYADVLLTGILIF